MKKLLIEIINQLEKLNKEFGEIKIDKNLFDEQKENIKKFQKTYEELCCQVEFLKSYNLTNKDLRKEKLIHLFVTFSNIIWCFDQLDDFMRLVIQKNPSD